MEESTSKERANGVVLSKFVEGIRVLVVDDNPTDLRVLEKMLLDCSYKVIKCQRGEDALSMLKEKRDGFDIVMTDVHMPNINGLQLLAEIVNMELPLPVIMFSGDAKEDVVMEGVKNGACDFLVKPIHIDTLRIIWRHVLRPRRSKSVAVNVPREPLEVQPTGSVFICASNGDINHVAENVSSPTNEESSQISLRRSREDDGGEQSLQNTTTAASAAKKPRMIWTPELHHRFIRAVHHNGGPRSSVPKKILESMRHMGDVPAGLTRQKISSHLQKYRLGFKKNFENSERLHNATTGYSNPSHHSIPAPISFRAAALALPNGVATQEDQCTSYNQNGMGYPPALPHQTIQQLPRNTIYHQQQQQHQINSNNLVSGNQISSDPFVARHHFNATPHSCALPCQTMNSHNSLNFPTTGMELAPQGQFLPPSHSLVSGIRPCGTNTDTTKGDQLAHAYYKALFIDGFEPQMQEVNDADSFFNMTFGEVENFPQ